MPPSARERIIAATRSRLLADGYAGLSTRRVADEAGVPLSQIHYHFGGKQGMVLALLGDENERLVERQREMYGTDVPLWRRYDEACELLDRDLDSGYVRVLQEMIAAGWSDPAVGERVLGLLKAWLDTLTEVAREAERRFGSLGPFGAEDVAGLIGLAFIGGESLILLGDEQWGRDIRGWLRRIGELIRLAEQSAAGI